MTAPATVLANTPDHAKPGLMALYAGGHVASKLSQANPLEVLARYLSDESTKEIAASYGCTRQALGYFLLQSAGDQWREAQIARAIARKEQADDEIEVAADALALARAREKLRSAQWDLERLLSRLFGQKQEITTINVDLGDRLRRARERVIQDVEPLPDQPTQIETTQIETK